MNKLNVWSNTIKQNIENQKNDIFKRDFQFFKIDRLERIAERIDKYSGNCSVCEQYKTEIEDLSVSAAKHINGSPRERSQFEKRNERIVHHLKEEHQIIQKDYYASVYTLAGLAAGVIIFGGIFYLIDIRYFIFGLLTGFTIGLIVGRIIGRKKDKQKEDEGLIL